MMLEPRYAIAEAFMRSDADIPSPATLARADQAIYFLKANGWHILRAGQFIAPEATVGKFNAELFADEIELLRD